MFQLCVFQALVQEGDGDNTTRYKSHGAASEIQASLATLCKERMCKRLQASPFIGLMLDESLDVAVQKKLTIFCKTIENGESITTFGANVEVKDEKAATIVAALTEFLRNVNVPVNKVSGIGTDGANVMVGSKTGVVVRLQSENPKIVGTWCVAHRLALVCSWAAKGNDYLQIVKTALVNIFNFYHYSACRYNKIRELKNLMAMKVKKFKRPTDVRWLSLHESIQALLSAWGCLILALGHEAASSNSDGAAKAKGILKVIKTYKFIGTLCFLNDVLVVLTRCSKTFQKDDIDIHMVLDMLEASVTTLDDMPDSPGESFLNFIQQCQTQGEYQGIPLHGNEEVKKVARQFVSHIKAQIQQRFPPDDMQVLKDLASILDPRHLPQRQQELRQHGSEALDRLLTRYSYIDAAETRQSFRHFTSMLCNHREKSLKEMCKHIITRYADVFPEFSTLACISLTIPVSSVPCERGFSSQNLIHTALRNSLGVGDVENEMIIKHESRRADFSDKELITSACSHFSNIKQRRK